MEVSRNPTLVRSIDNYLSGSPYHKFLEVIWERALRQGAEPIYWGSAVSKHILEQMHGKTIVPRDADVLIDDTSREIDLWRLMSGLNYVCPTQFGNTVNWMPEEEVKIGIVTFSTISRIGGGDGCISLEEVLRGCDITTSAVAYNPQKREVYYGEGALESFLSEAVDMLSVTYHTPVTLMCKVVSDAARFGFGIGERAMDYIRKNYTPALDGQIWGYLENKGRANEYRLAIDKLRHIAQPLQKPALVIL